MKIFFLVLMAVFLTSDIIVAAPANGEGKGEAEAPAAVEGEAEDPAVDEEGEAEEQVDVEGEAEDPAVDEEGEAEDPAVDEEGEAEDQVDEEGEAEDQVDEEGEADEDADDGEDEEDDDVDDKGRENETSKSQLDMILELRHQVKEEQRRNNVQRDQIKVQERKIEEQQRQNDEQQRQLEEITKINRARRGAENDIVEDLKELIRAEINGLSQCVVGSYTTKTGASKPGSTGFKDKKAVSFGRTFPRTPTVVASVAGFERVQQGTGDPTWGVKTEARSPTTSQFELHMEGFDTKVNRLDVSWIACV